MPSKFDATQQHSKGEMPEWASTSGCVHTLPARSGVATDTRTPLVVWVGTHTMHLA